MKLQHIDLSLLRVSALNVRKHGHKDVETLAHSIKTLGLLQPLLVRATPEGFEVIAGQRRLKACQLVAQEGGILDVPCAVMEDGDDAGAIEASLAENIERLPMDEIDQYEAFAAMIAKGRSVEDIAAQFGVTERLVRQRLAIAGLDDRILALFRKDEINGDTMRALTMASKTQQKAWLRLYRDPEAHAPTGRNLRSWLTGGQSIKTGVAIFPIEDYTGAVVADLFGEDSFFADPSLFWELQRKAISERSTAYAARGWPGVVVLDGERHFPHYDYVKTAKTKGGKVFVLVAPDGTVEFHEGYLSTKEVRDRQRKEKTGQTGQQGHQAPKAELTKPAQNYVDLHRHAAVQWNLVGNGFLTLRLVTAHILCGSGLWTVRRDRLHADKPDTAASRMASVSAVNFEDVCGRALALLGGDDQQDDEEPVRPDSPLDDEQPDDEDAGLDEDEGADEDDDDDVKQHHHGRALIQNGWGGRDLLAAFNLLMAMSDDDVMLILSVAMAESLSVTSPLIDTLGTSMNIGMAALWSCDDAFLDLVTSKDTLLAMLEDIGGEVSAKAHKESTGKTIRSVIRQLATGEGRAKVEGWLPPYLAFPASTYLGQEDAENQQDEPKAEAA